MNIGEKIKYLRTKLGYTQDELATYAGTTKQTIHKYETGIISNIPASKIKSISEKLQTTPSYLMGWEEKSKIDPFQFSNIHPVEKRKFRMLGEIACGQPITCNEEYETYIEASADINADFCLSAKGDSMINARIYDGDIVFIKEQPIVENGEIAAVIIDDESTLKRVYIKSDRIILRPENPLYDDIIYEKEEMNSVKILGKAVAFMSLVR